MHSSTNNHHLFPCLCLHSCNKKPNTTVPECTDEEQVLYESSGYCGILLDKKGPFAVCHPKVNPNVSAKTHSNTTQMHNAYALYQLIS